MHWVDVYYEKEKNICLFACECLRARAFVRVCVWMVIYECVFIHIHAVALNRWLADDQTQGQWQAVSHKDEQTSRVPSPRISPERRSAGRRWLPGTRSGRGTARGMRRCWLTREWRWLMNACMYMHMGTHRHTHIYMNICIYLYLSVYTCIYV